MPCIIVSTYLIVHFATRYDASRMCTQMFPFFATWYYCHIEGQAWCCGENVSPSQQVVGLKQPLCICGGGLASVYPFLIPHSCGRLWPWVCPS
jgi:hypothetical protein